MYSNIQKQCLHQLGIQAYELKSQASPELKSEAVVDKPQAERAKVISKTERPSLSSLLKPASTTFDWGDVATSLKQDLAVIMDHSSFKGDTLKCTSNRIWRVDESHQGVSFEHQNLLSTHPSKLSVEDKKLIWHWLSDQGEAIEN